MRYVEIDIEHCQHSIEVAKRRLQASSAPKYIKRLGAAIKPVILISNHKSPYLATASAVSEKCRDATRMHYHLTPSKYPTRMYKGRRYFMIIEVFPKAFTKWGKTRKYYLNKVLGHEMGHLLQIILYKEINGNWSTADPKTDHSKEWIRLSKWLGGNDSGEIS